MLNAAQQQAVDHGLGPLLVLAGAGSGKTRVITQRIVGLLQKAAPPRSIVALTFTNKAAGEMRERVAHLLSQRNGRAGAAAARELTISTFHAFGLQVLTRERQALGGAFTIFDQGDALGTVKDVLRGIRAAKSWDAAAVLARISAAKNAFLRPEDLPDHHEYDEVTKIVYPRYQALLRQYRAFDFDDLVCEVARLFADRPDVAARWQERYLHVLVDEYQDTNRAQFALLRHLAGRHRNVCVVGDDDQSIYAWRGADVRNILEFEEQFPGAKVVKLEQNYRSKGPILAVANAVIEKRVGAKYKKVLFTTQSGGDIVRVRVAATPDVEAAWVTGEIRRRVRDLGTRPRDVAVLYRSNGQAKLLEEGLREHGVPHRVVGGQQFFERKEVKDVLAYLRLAVNPADEIALRRIVNYPPRGIGETTVDRLAQNALAKGWSLWQAVERVDALDGITAGARDGCRTLERIVGTARRDLTEGKAASLVARELCEGAGIHADIEVNSGSAPVASRRWSNVEGLFRTFAKREAKDAAAGTKTDVAGLLQALSLDFGDDGDDGDKDAVTLSTLHGSKGLEFPVVFLIGCEEGLLPHSRTLDTRVTDAAPQDIEEERRLFYVGVTRAREELFLTRAKARVNRGKAAPRTPSRFLLEIPPNLVEEQEVVAKPGMDAQTVVEQADALLAALEGL